jgi:hypothetical protein
VPLGAAPRRVGPSAPHARRVCGGAERRRLDGSTKGYPATLGFDGCLGAVGIPAMGHVYDRHPTFLVIDPVDQRYVLRRALDLSSIGGSSLLPIR